MIKTFKVRYLFINNCLKYDGFLPLFEQIMPIWNSISRTNFFFVLFLVIFEKKLSKQ